MSRRIAPCRRYLSTTTVACLNSTRAYGSPQRTKSFVRHVDEDGEVFYTVATKEEGKDLPRRLRSNNLFEMPNLVLDLDAAGGRHVREFNQGDEASLADTWSQTPRRKAVRARMSWMLSNVGTSRSRTLEMKAKKTHPMHITDYDITSAALRGLTIGMEERKDLFPSWQGGGLQNHSGTEEHKEVGQEDHPGRLVVTALSQMDLRVRDRLPTAASPAAQELVHPSSDVSGIKHLIKEGDPRKRPDYMRNLRMDNGIPLYTSKNDEQLIRWVMLRQYNSNYTREMEKHTPPGRAEVVKAINSLPSPYVMRRHVFSIRRIIFQSLATGANLRVDGTRGRNVPLAIRDYIARVLDKFADNYPPHFDVLTFANNLAERLPDRDGDMAAALFSLRLRALAGMGLLGPTSAQLEQGVTSEMWDSGVDLMGDVSAAMFSWSLNLQQNPVLQTQDGQRNLFSILTGFGETGVTTSTSLRSLILDPRSHKGENPNIARLTVFGQYIEMLGTLKASRTLWMEWKSASGLLQAAQEEDLEQKDALVSYITSCFHRSILGLVGVTELPGESAGRKPSLENRAVMDWSSIRAQDAGPELEGRELVETGGAGGELSVVKRIELMKMMDLPLKDWLERVKRWS
ncbi:hypothetical protein ACO1O0_000753 [Amphichorda felina]